MGRRAEHLSSIDVPAAGARDVGGITGRDRSHGNAAAVQSFVRYSGRRCRPKHVRLLLVSQPRNRHVSLPVTTTTTTQSIVSCLDPLSLPPSLTAKLSEYSTRVFHDRYTSTQELAGTHPDKQSGSKTRTNPFCRPEASNPLP